VVVVAGLLLGEFVLLLVVEGLEAVVELFCVSFGEGGVP